VAVGGWCNSLASISMRRHPLAACVSISFDFLQCGGAADLHLVLQQTQLLAVSSVGVSVVRSWTELRMGLRVGIESAEFNSKEKSWRRAVSRR